MVADAPRLVSSTGTHGQPASPQVQHIFVHCEPDESEDIAVFCKESFRPRLAVQFLQPVAENEAALALRSRFRRPPPPYAFDEWETFLDDASVLFQVCEISSGMRERNLAASRNDRPERHELVVRSKENYTHLQAMRWPVVMVTDRQKLCTVACGPDFRDVLMDVAKLRQGDLPSVVNSSDFRHLCGALVMEAPLEMVPTLSLASHDGPEGGDDAPASSIHAGSEKPSLQCGVFLQRSRWRDADDSNSVPDSIPEEVSLFGSRCLLLLSDGRGAYSAVSPDGTRRVEANGAWQVLNGQVILRPSEENQCGRVSSCRASVHHLQLTQSSAPRPLPDTKYAELVHFSLEQLRSEFTDAKDLTDLVKFSGMEDVQRLCDDARPQSSSQSSPTKRRAALAFHDGLDDEIDCLQDATAGKSGRRQTLKLAGGARPTVRVSKMRGSVQVLCADQKSMSITSDDARTPALGQVTSATDSRVSSKAGATERSVPPASSDIDCLSPASRAFPASPAMQPARSAGSDAESVRSVKQSLGSFAVSLGVSEMRAFPCPSCPLRVGTYSWESGSKGDSSYKSFRLELHADGRCVYNERSHLKVLRSVPGCDVFWKLECSADDQSTIEEPSQSVLVLQCKPSASPNRGSLLDGLVAGARVANAFVLRSIRGLKCYECKVSRVEVPVSVLLQRCSFTPFSQELSPFPGYSPPLETETLCGIHRDSPLVQRLGFDGKKDVLPIHAAFEQELRSQGLLTDEHLSDMALLIKWSSGKVDARSLHVMEEKTSENTRSAPLEVMHQLISALCSAYGSLDKVFEHLTVANESPTPAEFEEFVLQDKADSDIAPEDWQPLKAWLEQTHEEDRAAALTAVSEAAVDEDDVLTLPGLKSLHVCSSALAAHRLMHVRSWIFETFGATKDDLEQVFLALNDGDAKNELNEAQFIKKMQLFGYPGSIRVLSSVFCLLDRNFNGSISTREFGRLRAFDASHLLESVEELRKFVCENFPSIDDCFSSALKYEQLMDGGSSGEAAVSYESIRKRLSLSGFSRAVKVNGVAIDLRMCIRFLQAATNEEGHSSGDQVTAGDWALLNSFDSSVLSGSSARLRRALEERYGKDLASGALQQLLSTWQHRMVQKRLDEAALAGLTRALGIGQLLAQPCGGNALASEPRLFSKRSMDSFDAGGSTALPTRTRMSVSSPDLHAGRHSLPHKNLYARKTADFSSTLPADIKAAHAAARTHQKMLTKLGSSLESIEDSGEARSLQRPSSQGCLRRGTLLVPGGKLRGL